MDTIIEFVCLSETDARYYYAALKSFYESSKKELMILTNKLWMVKSCALGCDAYGSESWFDPIQQPEISDRVWSSAAHPTEKSTFKYPLLFNKPLFVQKNGEREWAKMVGEKPCSIFAVEELRCDADLVLLESSKIQITDAKHTNHKLSETI